MNSIVFKMNDEKKSGVSDVKHFISIGQFRFQIPDYSQLWTHCFELILCVTFRVPIHMFRRETFCRWKKSQIAYISNI